MELNAAFPLIPAVSPGEREDSLKTSERLPRVDCLQRGNEFTLSDRMGEGRGEGHLSCCMLAARKEPLYG